MRSVWKEQVERNEESTMKRTTGGMQDWKSLEPGPVSPVGEKKSLAAYYLNHPREKVASRTGATLSRRISKSNVTIKLSPTGLGRFE